MKIYGRKLLDGLKIEIDFDELVFDMGEHEIVVSTYTAKTDGRVEVRCNTGIIVVKPRAANVILVEAHRG